MSTNTMNAGMSAMWTGFPDVNDRNMPRSPEGFPGFEIFPFVCGQESDTISGIVLNHKFEGDLLKFPKTTDSIA